MADEYKTEQSATPVEEAVETQDRGLFGFGKKPTDEEVIATEFEEKVQVAEVPEEEKKASLLEKLKRSDSSSSSSSDEEVGEDGEKKKKKKGLKEKLKEKLGTPAPLEEAPPVVVAPEAPPPQTEVKKGLLEKIKDKLPGGKKPEEAPVIAAPPPPHVAAPETTPVEEKKGLLEKIKDKLPGFHSKTEDEKVKDSKE